MSRLFIIQLIASFIVGGSFVALLSFIAERSSERIAGMIISLQNVIRYTTVQKIQRAIIAGGVITLAVFLSKVVNPFWGAIVSYFPVAYLTTFIILHWHYDSAFLFKVWKNSPLGSLVFITYPLVAMYTFPAFGIVIGTLTAYAASLVMFMVLRKLNRTSAT